MTLSTKPIRRFRGWMNRNLPLMITCGELESFLVDYLDGTLPPRARRRFSLHLKLCADCRAYLRSYEAVVALGQAVFDHPADAPPDTVPEDLVRAILHAREQNARGQNSGGQNTGDKEPQP